AGSAGDLSAALALFVSGNATLGARRNGSTQDPHHTQRATSSASIRLSHVSPHGQSKTFFSASQGADGSGSHFLAPPRRGPFSHNLGRGRAPRSSTGHGFLRPSTANRAGAPAPWRWRLRNWH